MIYLLHRNKEEYQSFLNKNSYTYALEEVLRVNPHYISFLLDCKLLEGRLCL